MDRKDFLKALALAPLAGASMKLSALNKLAETFETTERMPVLFVGHGNPMNAIEDNRFSREMRAVGQKLPIPKAILVVSAHWETRGTFVTAQANPQTIHDFGGFPKALFEAQYPAPGSPWLAEETKKAIITAQVGLSHDWGFDHGCWSVTMNMFPKANIPIIQLSLDRSQPASYHYALAKQLAVLRTKGVLIIGSGNMIHNLGMVGFKPGSRDFNEPYAYDWNQEADALFKKLIQARDHESLMRYTSLGKAVQLAVPTPEHYLPMLYALALQKKEEETTMFNDVPVAGAFTMTSLLIS